MESNGINLTKALKYCLKEEYSTDKRLFKLHPADIAEVLEEIQNGSQKHLLS